MNSLILTVVGVGPGDPGLVTVGALKAISGADVVLGPCAKDGRLGVAAEIVRAHLPELDIVPFLFPMTNDAKARDSALRNQIRGLHERTANARSVVLPVIGDSALYATGSYLYDVWRELVPDIELRLIPGVSAHSLAAARAGIWLAMAEEVLAVIPGTADAATIANALSAANSAAIYKPSAVKGGLEAIVRSTGPWSRMIRVDRAGLPDERIIDGEGALVGVSEYLSVLLLRR